MAPRMVLLKIRYLYPNWQALVGACHSLSRFVPTFSMVLSSTLVVYWFGMYLEFFLLFVELEISSLFDEFEVVVSVKCLLVKAQGLTWLDGAAIIFLLYLLEHFIVTAILYSRLGCKNIR